MIKCYFFDSKEDIPGSNPIQVSLNDAMAKIDEFHFADSNDGTFIGFINEKDETIQFIPPEDKEQWILDIPIMKNGKFSHADQYSGLSIESVKGIITLFFEGKEIYEIVEHIKIKEN